MPRVLLVIGLLWPMAAPAGELKLPAGFYSIVDLANGAGPEFASDALLRAVESGKIDDKPSRRTLITQAFFAAASAHERIPRKVIAGAGIDTEAGMMSEAYDLHLDALSLQSRAVRLMLTIDPKAARQMFLDMPRPALPALACEDALAYDVSGYFNALGGVLDKSFTAAERAKEEHVNFALDYVGGIASPSPLGPALRLVAASTAFNAAQRDLLLSRMGGILESMQPDSRSFEAARQDIEAAMPSSLQPAWAKLKQRMTSGAQCGQLDPRASQNVTPASAQPTGNMPKPQPLWQSPESKDIIEAAKKVRFGNSNHATPEWQDAFTMLLDKIAAWQPSDSETPSMYYHERCTLYEGLTDVAATAAQRQRLLDDFIGFVAASGLQRDSPAEWFFHVPLMLRHIPDSGGGEGRKALDAFIHSGNPSLTLYATLEKLIPASPGTFH